jgi:hypothetical protein
MKTFCLTRMIALVIICWTNGAQAQNSETKLDQVQLMKQFIGTWIAESYDSSIMILDYKPFGDAIVGNAKVISQDEDFDMKKYFLGYDGKNDKIIVAEIYYYTPIIDITACWFISKNIMNSVPYQDISNPENATMKWKFEFKSPDRFVITSLQNNTVTAVDEWIREKK